MLLLDSNIIIDHLNDVSGATELLRSRSELAISIITRIEVLAGVSPDDVDSKSLMMQLVTFDVTTEIASLAIDIRRGKRLKLPDAIILATARHLRCQLATRNTKDFDPSDPAIFIPYTIT